jgi:penicillin-binding protein-related factor A (putative recombinase)
MSQPRPIPSTYKKKRRPAADSEANIQKSIITFLERIGAVVLRTNSGHVVTESGAHIQMGAAGTSDLTACYQGRFVAIEVKKPGNKPTVKQQAYLDRVTAAGGLAFVATSIDDVQEALDL